VQQDFAEGLEYTHPSLNAAKKGMISPHFGRVIYYVQVERTERCASLKGTPFLEGVSTLYEMCIIVLFVNVLGWCPVYYSTISIARY